MRISCLQIDRLKEPYVDGLLSPQVRAAIEEHAGNCARCTQRIAIARQVKAAMGGAVRAALSSPAAVPASNSAAPNPARAAGAKESARGMRGGISSRLGFRPPSLATGVVAVMLVVSVAVGLAQ